MKALDDHAACWYCGMPLAPRHEHDHIPPRRHGGTATVPACLNCHEMKDRVPLSQWPPDVVMAALLDVPPGPARLLMAKLAALALDMEAVPVRTVQR